MDPEIECQQVKNCNKGSVPCIIIWCVVTASIEVQEIFKIKKRKIQSENGGIKFLKKTEELEKPQHRYAHMKKSTEK